MTSEFEGVEDPDSGGVGMPGMSGVFPLDGLSFVKLQRPKAQLSIYVEGRSIDSSAGSCPGEDCGVFDMRDRKSVV